MDQEKTGKFICSVRRELGLTQEQLGERLGVTNKTISRWETGKYMPDIDKLQELSNVLGVSIHELLAGERLQSLPEFRQKAEETLVQVLSGSPAFSLQERIGYFKRKWLWEHKALVFGCVVVWLVLLCAAVYWRQPVVFALLPLAGLFLYAYVRNQMMIYVEDRAFDPD